MSRQDKLAHLFFFAFAPPPKSLSQRQRSPIRREGSQRGSHSLVLHLQNQCSSHWRCTDNFHENKISVQWRDTSTLSDKYAHSKIFAESDTHTCVSGLHPLKSKNSIIHDSSNSFFIYSFALSEPSPSAHPHLPSGGSPISASPAPRVVPAPPKRAAPSAKREPLGPGVAGFFSAGGVACGWTRRGSNPTSGALRKQPPGGATAVPWPQCT